DGYGSNGKKRRILTAFLLAIPRRIPGGIKRSPGILGCEQRLLFCSRLQHTHGETGRNSKNLRRSAQSEMEGSDDVVDESRLGRSDVYRERVAAHGDRKGKSLSAAPEDAKRR